MKQNDSAKKDNPFAALSEAMSAAVEHAAQSTLLVDARQRLPASGFAFAADLVLTADHVVEREEDIQVMLPGGERVGAKVAGRDAASDLALLRLESAVAVPARAAAQDGKVGQLALALGRPSPHGIQAGLAFINAVSGPLRTARGSLVERCLWTDATPYPGFSGGALVDAYGDVLGLNTSGLAHGVLLTLPAAFVWQTAEALVKYGHIRRGYLGIRSQVVELSAALRQEAQGTLLNQESGLLINHVVSESPAEKAGLMVGDILVNLAGQPVTDADDLQAILLSAEVDKTTETKVVRGGQIATVSVTIGSC